MSFWGKFFGKARSNGTYADTLFQENVIAAAAMCMTLHQYKPPPQMQHVSYEDQAADFLVAALRGDIKAQHILMEMIAYFPEQLFAEPLDEATMRQLMQRALNGDQAAQKRVASLLQTLVRNEEPDMTAEQETLWQRDQRFVSLAESQLSHLAPSMYQQAGRGFFLFDERERSLETQGEREIAYWEISEITQLPISKAEGDIIRASVATYLVESQFVVVILHTDTSISVHQCNSTLANSAAIRNAIDQWKGMRHPRVVARGNAEAEAHTTVWEAGEARERLSPQRSRLRDRHGYTASQPNRR